MSDVYECIELKQVIIRGDGEPLTEEDASTVSEIVLKALNEKAYTCSGTVNLVRAADDTQ